MKRLTLLSLAAVLAASACAQTFHLTDMGTLGGASSRAFGMNSSGQIVGYALNSSGAMHAFLYTGGTMQDLGANGGVGSTAKAINDSGVIVGDYTFATGSDPVRKGYKYSGGSMQDIGSLGGAWNEPYGINNSGQIVGISNTTVTNQFRAYLYSAGTYTNLGTLGGDWSYANGINDSGVVVGDANTTAEQEHGFRYAGSSITDVGLLPGFTNGATAYAINASGQIAGYSYGVTNSEAFIANGTTLTPLGILPGHSSLAFGINSSGTVVGGSEFMPDYTFATTVAGGHGFYWKNGTITDLNSMVDGSASGWTILEGSAINDKGQIAGTAINASGATHAVFLTPVPEPCSLLVLSGASLLALRRRRAKTS